MIIYCVGSFLVLIVLPGPMLSRFKGLAPHAADLAVSTPERPKNESWGIPVVTAGLASKFLVILTRLC